MGETAENVAERWGVSRERQDAFALESQQRAVAAIEAGRFDDQLVPVTVPQKKGDPVVVDARRAPARRHDRGGAGEAPPGVPSGRRIRHGRQQLRDQRRRLGGPARRGRPGPRPRASADGPRRLDGGRGRRPGGHGHRAGAGHAARRSSGPGSASRTSTSIELNEAFASQSLVVHRRARARPGQGQRQRRRDRARPSARA